MRRFDDDRIRGARFTIQRQLAEDVARSEVIECYFATQVP